MLSAVAGVMRASAVAFQVGAMSAILFAGSAAAGTIEVFHADSLAGPMRELKKAFEAKNAGVTINLTTGVSKQLAERILNGEICDVFAPSSPAVMDQDLMGRKIANSDREAASWYAILSANEMVLITAKGNPVGIKQVIDLAKPGVKYVRVTGEKDLATGRTIEFVKRATNLEGKPDLAQAIIDAALIDPAKPTGVPDAVRAVRDGTANAGIVYYSAAVAAGNEVDAVRFPASVNMCEAIRNAATVTGTAKNPTEATTFVAFLLSAEGQRILLDAGQPSVTPAILKGNVPAEVRN
jgi:molybdate transport system substrate-binding protein